MSTSQFLIPTTTLIRSTPPTELPAAQSLAVVSVLKSGREVTLPPRFARAAVEEWLKWFRADGDVVEGPCGPEAVGRPLQADEWAIRVRHAPLDLRLRPREVCTHRGSSIFVFARWTVSLAATAVPGLLRALERVKPEEIDDQGRPLPWVPVRFSTEALAQGTDDEEDAVLVEEHAPPPADQPSEISDSPLTTAEIQAAFDRLRHTVGLAPVPLTVSRGTVNKLGFTTGRVWYGAGRNPLRVHLTTCPNADLAEVLATAVHELAHPLSGARGHGDLFKATLVSLAEQVWGPSWFVEARNRLAESFRVIDAWMATGIRAALRSTAPPTARVGDDGQMARVVTRIRQLRALAADQMGRPEAITATALANDLVTTYGLGDHAIRIDAGIDEQMVDRWVLLHDGAVWRRTLAHGVAKACGVFALAAAGRTRMHFFGRHADVVQAEYLYSISAERIARECDRHLVSWRHTVADVGAGDTVRERTSFCDAAVRAFCLKLGQIVVEESGGRRASAALEAAEDFARGEHEKRGMGWVSGGRRAARHNAAGRAVGQSMEVVRGLSSTDGSPRALPARR